ncbi:hypothetical protein [Kitasatospora phosalacinea]|uniref:hypothetical protein n=1 Tax=Kitasatospora phosalacinea TaxID=2065 RepID=UPI0036C8F896
MIGRPRAGRPGVPMVLDAVLGPARADRPDACGSRWAPDGVTAPTRDGSGNSYRIVPSAADAGRGSG